MTKAQAVAKKEKSVPKMGVKDGLVAKKKKQDKFKSTPTGKVALVNTSKSQNGSANGTPKSSQKGKNKKEKAKPKAEPKPKEVEEDEVDSEDDDESMEDSEEEAVAVGKKGVKPFKGLKAEVDDVDDDDDEDDDDDDDEDDDDDDDDDDDEDDDDDDEDDDDDDEEEEDEVDEDSSVGLKALLGDSIADDDDDDDFDEDDESDEDDDISDDADETLNNSKDSVDDDDDDDDDEDDDDEDDDDDDDDDEEEDGKELGLKDLLGESLADEEDDEDFEEDDEDDDDDDEDMSDDSDEAADSAENKKEAKPSKKSKSELESPKPKRLSSEEQAALDARTIYVGNVPKEITVKTVKKLFRPFGEIDTIRVRGVVAEDSRMSAKVATITKKMHPKVSTVYVYVAFKEEQSAKDALKLNGHKLGENTLRVDLSTKNKDHDQKKAVFLGNIPFDITEDEVRKHFDSCGKIESVRIVKDRKSGLSRGIGYVNFKDEDSVTLALELNETNLKNREIRVKICSPEPKGKKRKHGGKPQKQGPKDSAKKFKGGKGQAVTVEAGEKHGRKKQKRSQGETKREKSSEGGEKQSPSPAVKKEKQSFQGQKADTKKRSKANKGDKKKKILAEKLTAKKKAKSTD